MDSGWIVNYKSGDCVIYSEKKYKEIVLPSELARHIEWGEHWFDIRQAIEKHPWLQVIQ